MKKLFFIVVGLASLVAGMFLSKGFIIKPSSTAVTQTQTGIPGMLWPNPKILTPFTLVDQHNQAFDLDSLKNQWSLIFFGYTHCPDVCPSTMTLLNSVVKDLPEDKKAKIIFVSVDPERDTQEKLKSYIDYFNSEIVGLTGTNDQINALTKQIGVLSDKIVDPKAEDQSNYLMDHSASILLINPDSKMIGIFSTPHTKADITKRYTAIREFVEKL